MTCIVVPEIISDLKNTVIEEQKILQLEYEQIKFDIHEKNAHIEQQIDEFKKEQKQMKDKIAGLECLTQHSQKKRCKRKKINKDVRQQVVDKQENTCGECKLGLTSYFELDHIVGLQFGGTDDESNLMALCRECHAMKSMAENHYRDKIKDAIQTILREKLNNDQRV